MEQQRKNIIYSACCYIPAGGAQLPVCLIGLFQKDRFYKFHALQAIIYWVVAVAFLLVVVYIPDPHLGSLFNLSIVLFIIPLVLFVIPLILAFQTYKNKHVFLPLIGKKIAMMVGLL